jgi:O-acetyl-ADP-ribose deacetylase (regulator of RNase III)
MHVIQGDLLELALMGEFDVVVHGCNCQCAMGAGIAKTIKDLFPEAYRADCATRKGDQGKLGTISHAEIVRDGTSFTIVNAYTQFHWRGKGINADYSAIRGAMTEVKRQFSGRRIGYPLIGAGLAGGDWNVIAPIIDQTLTGENHTLVRYHP